jgi:ferredoxin, 2Fe-2S
MPKMTFLPHQDVCPNGAEIEVKTGTSICRAALDNGIELEHACELSCACTTCHVIVREGFDSLTTACEQEEDLLDKAWGLEAESRLACQALIGDKDLLIEIPRYTLNYAKETH